MNRPAIWLGDLVKVPTGETGKVTQVYGSGKEQYAYVRLEGQTKAFRYRLAALKKI